MATSTLHDQLASTAKAHLLSCLPATKGSNDPDPAAILSYLDPSFLINWGHSFFVDTAPPLQGDKTGEGFVAHLSGMAKALQTWDIAITDLCVDERQRSAVVRADFYMMARGAKEAVLNEILFWIWMDESGRKVVKCTEFVDPVASAELARRMKEGAAAAA